jgi:hypothetical protein
MDFTFYLRYGQQTPSFIEARRPIVRLRQRSRRPWNIQTAGAPSFIEARRPIVRLRQRSRRPWNIQTAGAPSYGGSSTNCSTPTAIPSARGCPDKGGRSHQECSLPELRESVEKRRLEYLQTRRENTFSLGFSSLGNYSG